MRTAPFVQKRRTSPSRAALETGAAPKQQGAARAALGPELPAVFSSDDAAWRELERAAAEQVWAVLMGFS